MYVVVVDQLALRGYQPHFDELLLRLNFSDYYKWSPQHCWHCIIVRWTDS